jgi:hypothetical protein
VTSETGFNFKDNLMLQLQHETVLGHKVGFMWESRFEIGQFGNGDSRLARHGIEQVSPESAQY